MTAMTATTSPITHDALNDGFAGMGDFTPGTAEDIISKLYQLEKHEVTLQDALLHAQAVMDTAKAILIVEGTPGSNAEQRAAVLKLILNRDPPPGSIEDTLSDDTKAVVASYREAASRHERLTRELALCRVDMSHAKRMLGLCRDVIGRQKEQE